LQSLDGYGKHSEQYSFADAVRALWPTDLSRASAQELAVLAAGLGSQRSDRPIKVLEAARKAASNAPERRRALELLLSWAYSNVDNQSAAADLLRPLHEAFPQDVDLWRRWLGALYWAKRHVELLPALDDFDKKHPDNDLTVGLRYGVERREGRVAVSLQRAQERMSTHLATRSELNNVAWGALFVPSDLKAVLPIAQAACEPQSTAPSNMLHTLATIQAELGDYGNARAQLNLSMSRRGGNDIQDHEWYTWGRIAEGLGYRDEARAAYQRVEKPEYISDVATYELAQRRLKALKR
jgi:tetratricopeptide (TPR) repeat protein